MHTQSWDQKIIKVMSFILVFSFAFQVACTKKTDDTDETINAVLNANVKGLDPIYSSDTYSNTVVAQIYEPLLHYHYLKRPLTLEPLLAAEMPKVSEDGLIHTFKIKQGVKFHDDPAFPEGKGRELKAQDFIYAWKRLSDPRNQSDGFWIFDNRIEGLEEWRDKVTEDPQAFDTEVSGMRAIDDHTLQIKLIKPYFQLHYVLAMPYSAPVAKEVVEKYGKEFLNHPVGTGPFKFESWTRNSKIVLVKNPTYRGSQYPKEGEPEDANKGLLKDAGKALPLAQKIVFHEIVQDQPRWLKFLKGNVDSTSIPKDSFDSAVQSDGLVKDMKEKGIRLMITSEPDVTYTAFNMLDEDLGKNENLRKAMSLAFDTPTLIERFYNGRAVPAHSPIPPEVDAYDEDFKNPYKGPDIEKAKEYLKKAGFEEGEGAPQIEYSTTNSPTARQMGEFFKNNMAKIGLDVKIVTSSWPQFTEKIREKKAQVWGIAWLADYPDAENFLQLLYGGNVSPGPNGSNYKNPEFDKLYQEAALLPPGPKRTEIYRKMRDIVVEDAPWIPNAHRLGYYVYHSWLKNYKRHSIIHDYFKYLRVDAKQRAKAKEKL